MDTLCRVCIERAAKCTSINSKIEDSSSLSFLGFLNKCTSLNARDGDSLPQNLCSNCADSMKMFYTFVKLAEKSDIILREALKNLVAKGRYKSSGETSSEEITIRNAKIKEESEDFNQADPFHTQPSRNSTGPKLYILDIVKEEPHVSETTSIADLKDAEINEGENFESNLDHPKGSIEELDEILSCIDRRVASINAEQRTDFEDEVPISLLKWKLGKNVEETDSQNNVLFEVHCIPSKVKKKTDKTKAESKEVIKEGISGPQSVRGSSRLIDNNKIPCNKPTTRNEKVEEASFQCQPSENATGSSLILDIAKARINNKNISQTLNKSPKEELRVSEHTSIVDLKDAKINESGTSETKLNHLEKSNEKPDDILSPRNRRLASTKTEHTDSEDDVPISILKRRLAKNEDGADSQRNSCEEILKETIGHGCKICDKKFCSKHYLNVHMEYHKRIRQKCNQCGKEFTFKNNLQRHLKWHTNPKPFNCEYCGESFARKPSYNMHMDNCKRRNKPQQLNKTKNDCGICDKKFSTKKYLNLHMKSHKRIKCHQCGKELKHENSLNNHLKWHANPKPFVCEICNKEFSKKDYLVVHMERHMGITQKCDQCGKEFKHRCSLSRHMREHSNPKPFNCEHCGKSFSRKFRYIEHMDICKRRDNKAQQLNKKKPECGVCGKKFSRKDSLNQHMKNHKVITKNCDLCGKEFKDSLFLKYHMKWHDKPKPYTCENCGKPLSSKPSYARHKRNCKPLSNSFGKTVTIEEPSLHPEGSEDIEIKINRRTEFWAKGFYVPTYEKDFVMQPGVPY